jgi:hypothetical protein
LNFEQEVPVKKMRIFLPVLLGMAALPVSAQYRFAATVNPLPAIGFFFGGSGIGASFEAAPLRNLAFKGNFSIMRLDMAEVTDSETFSVMDTNLLMLGLSARYYFFNRYLEGLFGGLRIKYAASSMENTFTDTVPFRPATVKAEFNDILLGAELGYKFIFTLNDSIGLYIEPSLGYNVTVKSGGNYDGSRESYKENIPSKYRSYADWIFGKGFVVGLSMGLAF